MEIKAEIFFEYDQDYGIVWADILVPGAGGVYCHIDEDFPGGELLLAELNRKYGTFVDMVYNVKVEDMKTEAAIDRLEMDGGKL